MDEKRTHEELTHYVQSSLKFENCKAVSLNDESCPWLIVKGLMWNWVLELFLQMYEIRCLIFEKRLVDERSIKIHRCSKNKINSLKRCTDLTNLQKWFKGTVSCKCTQYSIFSFRDRGYSKEFVIRSLVLSMYEILLFRLCLHEEVLSWVQFEYFIISGVLSQTDSVNREIIFRESLATRIGSFFSWGHSVFFPFPSHLLWF